MRTRIQLSFSQCGWQLKWVVLLGLIICPWSYGDEVQYIHDETQTDLRQLVDRVDDLLGGKRSDDKKDESTLRLSASDSTSRFTKQHDPHFGIRFTLKPGVFKTWQNQVRDWFRSEREHFEKEHLAQASGATEKAKEGAGPRPSDNARKDPWMFSLDKRFVLARRPNYWIHARLAKDLETHRFIHSFSTEAGWSRSQKWRSITSLSSSARLSHKWTFNVGHEVLWAISEKTFNPSHGISVSQILTHDQLIQFSAGVSSAVTKGSLGVAGYSLDAHYRWEIKQDGLYASVGGSLGFAKDHHFASDPGGNALLEAVF